MEHTKNRWGNILSEERETYIHFDNFSKIVIIFTRDCVVSKHIEKKIGEANIVERTSEGKIFSKQWSISFSNREAIRKAISISNFISYRTTNLLKK